MSDQNKELCDNKQISHDEFMCKSITCNKYKCNIKKLFNNNENKKSISNFIDQ
jgi:hypothetical protein